MDVYFFGDLTIPAIILAVALVVGAAWWAVRSSRKKVTVADVEDFVERIKADK